MAIKDWFAKGVRIVQEDTTTRKDMEVEGEGTEGDTTPAPKSTSPDKPYTDNVQGDEDVIREAVKRGLYGKTMSDMTRYAATEAVVKEVTEALK